MPGRMKTCKIFCGWREGVVDGYVRIHFSVASSSWLAISALQEDLATHVRNASLVYTRRPSQVVDGPFWSWSVNDM